MKSRLLLVNTFLASCFIFSTAHGQNNHFAYAVTDFKKDGSGWSYLRKLDLQTGLYSDVFQKDSKIKPLIYDHTTRKQLEIKSDPGHENYIQSLFSTGVAAIAYDKNNDRLYYTPMFINELRYIDFGSMKVFYVTDKPFTSNGVLGCDQGKIMTRMALAPDGYGYALSNDGNTFVRFTTAKETVITELGSLIDDAHNESNSIHDIKTSYGGDIVADDAGNLYLISASSHVFSIHIQTKVAKYLGKVTGLPEGYSTNGMAVDENGQLLVCSAGSSQGIFSIDPKNWAATKFKTANGSFASSDLANGNILSNKVATIEISNKARLYPNPVQNSAFTIAFEKINSGDYTIILTDQMGRQVYQRKVHINSQDQTLSVNLPAFANGVLLVRLLDQKGKAVFSKKLVVTGYYPFKTRL